MKCSKCGYDWSNSGDSAHICASSGVIKKLLSAKVPKLIEWWEVENTGWSAGQSWFSTGPKGNEYRAASQLEAIRYIEETRWDDPSVLWRYVHVTLEREDNKSVETRVWTEVK